LTTFVILGKIVLILLVRAWASGWFESIGQAVLDRWSVAE
jgi:hypothetical protein